MQAEHEGEEGDVCVGLLHWGKNLPGVLYYKYCNCTHEIALLLAGADSLCTPGAEGCRSDAVRSPSIPVAIWLIWLSDSLLRNTPKEHDFIMMQ